MNNIRLFFVALMLLMYGAVSARYVYDIDSPVDYVYPLMGTQSKFLLSHGNVYPAIALTWGMNF